MGVGILPRPAGRSAGDLGFEAAIETFWNGIGFVTRAPVTAAWLKTLAEAPGSVDGGYAKDMGLGFRSQWLAGGRGKPGAVHIEAPPETNPGAGFCSLNRPPHQHDSGRIAVVTSGRAIFHVKRIDGAGAVSMMDCPVKTGDMVFWPAWTPHTFNARHGFSLVSAMASYVSPAEDGFVFPVDQDLDTLPRMKYRAARA